MTKNALPVIIASFSVIAVVLLLIVLFNSCADNSRRASDSEFGAFEVVDPKTDQRPAPEEGTGTKEEPDGREVAGGSAGAKVILIEGSISSINRDEKTISVTVSETDSHLDIENKELIFDCNGPRRIANDVTFDQLYVGKYVEIELGWPQGSEILVGVITVPE